VSKLVNKMAQNGRANRVIVMLIVIILILVGILAYTFAIKPTIDGYVVKKQLEAQSATANQIINNMLTQLQTRGYVVITDANGQSLVLAPVPNSELEKIEEQQGTQ
jgi:CHASE3 domain sensor protein